MKVVVLAGGGGTRLWPLSRGNYPKQFLRINSERSFLQQTLERLGKVSSPEDILIVTNRDYKFYVLSDLLGLSISIDEGQILFEPSAKNTAPAIALAIKHCLDSLRCDSKEIMLVCPSDHILSPDEELIKSVKCAELLAKEGYIVAFGLKPTHAETAYGYIKAEIEEGIEIGGVKCPLVDAFVEKPAPEAAEEFYRSGQYYWNSGMFAFRIDSMIEEIRNQAPEISLLLDVPYEQINGTFSRLPNISIDYAVMERAKRVALVPLNLQWNDIGSWDAIYNILEKDSKGNALKGDIRAIDTKNCLIIGEHHHIAAIGLEECLIIDTPDALLVSKKGESQKVKEVVNSLKTANRQETELHLTCHRPWGSFTVLEEAHRYKIKRIVVKPGERLSLQMHYHRSEHWVVVKGAARVTIGDRVINVHENESVYVPKSTLHRLENPGKIPLEIIEVQNGEYVGEDDILRLEDNYQRDSST